MQVVYYLITTGRSSVINVPSHSARLSASLPVCLSTVQYVVLPTTRTALRRTDATLAGWSQLLILIFQFFFPLITSPAVQAAHETGKEHLKSPATSSSVDPALPTEAFYLGNFKVEMACQDQTDA